MVTHFQFGGSKVVWFNPEDRGLVLRSRVLYGVRQVEEGETSVRSYRGRPLNARSSGRLACNVDSQSFG